MGADLLLRPEPAILNPTNPAPPVAPEIVLFGVHPYDVVAIAQMDRLFTEGQYDAHYAARRAQLTTFLSWVVRSCRNSLKLPAIGSIVRACRTCRRWRRN